MTKDEEIALLQRRIEQARWLLKNSHAYVKTHWERSVYGTGVTAKLLFQQIEDFLRLTDPQEEDKK